MKSVGSVAVERVDLGNKKHHGRCGYGGNVHDDKTRRRVYREKEAIKRVEQLKYHDSMVLEKTDDDTTDWQMVVSI